MESGFASLQRQFCRPRGGVSGKEKSKGSWEVQDTSLLEAESGRGDDGPGQTATWAAVLIASAIARLDR
jgi:hypothetical protein